MYAHSIGGESWWHGSPVWTFTPHLVAVWQMTEGGQSDKRVSGMEVCMKQVSGIEFLPVEQIVLTDIHQYLLNIYGYQTVVDGLFQQWWQWVTYAGAGFYEHCTRDLVHRWWKCRSNGGGCGGKYCSVVENFLYQVVLSYSLYLV